MDKRTQIKAGRKVKQAGMQLSEYVMPGLGGQALSREHALETADALNQINPDFIRIRTLAIPGRLELFKDCQSGQFMKLNDVQAAKELLDEEWTKRSGSKLPSATELMGHVRLG